MLRISARNRRTSAIGLVIGALAACGPGSTSAGVPGVRLLDDDASIRRGDAGRDLGPADDDVKDGGLSLIDSGAPPPPPPPAPPPPPPGDHAAYCRSCSSAADCDGGENRCLRNSMTGAAFCGVSCEGGCPDGAECAAIGDGAGHVVAMLCVPPSGRCTGVTPPPPAPPPPPPPPPDTSRLCAPCASDATCGGAPNRCLQNLSGETFCGSDCSTDGVCPASYECAGIGDGAGHLVAQQCVPSSGTCSATPPPPPPTDAGPPPDLDAGPPDDDAGARDPDTGATPRDAGAIEPDAAVPE